mgnify:CR=1 FL=1
MTNAEKYKEVFGMEVDPSNCPTKECEDCPCAMTNTIKDFCCTGGSTYEWWNSCYKEVNSDND